MTGASAISSWLRLRSRDFGGSQGSRADRSNYKKPERQFELTTTGRAIDILCRRRGTEDYVVIELKQAKATDPVGRLLRYMAQVDRKLAKPQGVKVEGIIISPIRNTILEEALRGSIKNYPV